MHTHIDAKHMKLKTLRKKGGEDSINEIERLISLRADNGYFSLFYEDRKHDLKIVAGLKEDLYVIEYFELKGYYIELNTGRVYIRWK